MAVKNVNIMFRFHSVYLVAQDGLENYRLSPTTRTVYTFAYEKKSLEIVSLFH